MELENLDEIDFNENNCADFKLIDDIIDHSKVRNDNFTNNKLYIIFEIVCSDIYNKYLINFLYFLFKKWKHLIFFKWI